MRVDSRLNSAWTWFGSVCWNGSVFFIFYLINYLRSTVSMFCPRKTSIAAASKVVLCKIVIKSLFEWEREREKRRTTKWKKKTKRRFLVDSTVQYNIDVIACCLYSCSAQYSSFWIWADEHTLFCYANKTTIVINWFRLCLSLEYTTLQRTNWNTERCSKSNTRALVYMHIKINRNRFAADKQCPICRWKMALRLNCSFRRKHVIWTIYL